MYMQALYKNYKNAKSRIKIGIYFTEKFPIPKRLKQESIASHHLSLKLYSNSTKKLEREDT